MTRNWIVPWTVLILCGCIPYVAPSLVITKPIDLREIPDEVHVFRVDISSKSGAPCYGEEEFSLSRVQTIAGVVPPQAQAGLDRGTYIFCIALNYHFHYHEGVHVRLYRPGFELAQFKSWEFAKDLEWKPVSSIAAHESAIDELLAKCGTVDWCSPFAHPEQDRTWRISDGLRPGSYSQAHREALLFAAAEYDRLSNRPECTEEDRARLRDKSAKVKEHAER